MKFSFSIIGLCAALVLCGLAGCGSASVAGSLTIGAIEIPGSPAKPRIQVPPGPPPEDLVVRVLKRGFGPRATWGKRLLVQYAGVWYGTGKPAEARWGEDEPFAFTLGIGEVRKGWDIGLKGMKIGGRRELILPSRLAYGTGALVYVVELLGFE